MSIYDYEQAFGAPDKTGTAMRKAIDRWFAMYYDNAVEADSDTCQRIPYAVVNKLVVSIFGEHKATATTPFGQKLLKELDKQKRNALQLALVGGVCYIKPCPIGTGFSFTLIPRNRVLIFGRDLSGVPTDMGFVERATEGNSYYTLLERRTVDAKGYLTIRNRLFRSRDSRNLGAEVPLTQASAFKDLVAEYRFSKPIGSVGLAELKLPILNCIDGSADGVAVYAAAEGLIRNINANEAQMNGEFARGESRIIASRDLLDKELGLQEHLFIGLDEDPERVGLTVFSPNLREESFLARKHEYLRNVESVLSLKRGMLSDSNKDDRTATEITASAAEFSMSVMGYQQMWQQAVEDTLALCEILGGLYGYGVCSVGTVNMDWGNGTLYDQEKTWADYMQMVEKGILKPEVALAWRFGMEGEDYQSIREKLMPNTVETGTMQA